jgi:hypothetical protein
LGLRALDSERSQERETVRKTGALALELWEASPL